VQSKRLEDSNSLFGWEDMLRVRMKAGRNAVGDLVNADFVMGGAVLKNCRSMLVLKAFVVVGKLCRSIFPILNVTSLPHCSKEEGAYVKRVERSDVPP